jgi:hypothetical protein
MLPVRSIFLDIWNFWDKAGRCHWNNINTKTKRMLNFLYELCKRLVRLVGAGIWSIMGEILGKRLASYFGTRDAKSSHQLHKGCHKTYARQLIRR